jgi:hypothetical protein
MSNEMVLPQLEMEGCSSSKMAARTQHVEITFLLRYF